MSELEFRIAFWTLILSSVLNLVTIGCNIYWNSVGKKEHKRLHNHVNIRETVIKFYLPIKHALLQLELYQMKIVEKERGFDVFSLYNEKAELRILRNELLKQYQKFIDEYDKLEARYASSTIDKYLDRVYTHIQFVLCVEEQNVLNRYRERYKMPCLSEIIDEIDRYAQTNNVF